MFIEDNWAPDGSATARSTRARASWSNMFDFHGPKNPKPVPLDPTTGAVVSKH